MRHLLADTLSRLATWLRPKAMPSALAGNQWTGTSYIDSYKRNRQPTSNELMAELKNTAWACISLNSAICANHPPVLYVTTDTGDRPAKCRTKTLHPRHEKHLRSRKHLPARITKAARIEEAVEHPLLSLLDNVNPVHNSFDHWELTTLYQEVHGSCYWYFRPGRHPRPDLGPPEPERHYTPDLLVFGGIVVELKAVTEPTQEIGTLISANPR